MQYIKKIEILPSLNEYFDHPLKIERKDLVKSEKEMGLKQGFSFRRKVLKILHEYPIEFKVRIWFKR